MPSDFTTRLILSRLPSSFLQVARIASPHWRAAAWPSASVRSAPTRPLIIVPSAQIGAVAGDIGDVADDDDRLVDAALRRRGREFDAEFLDAGFCSWRRSRMVIGQRSRCAVDDT